MVRRIIISILIILVIGGGAWYYFSRSHYDRIENILLNPKAYEGKVLSIEGEVTDRTAFFIVVKFYKIRDKTGEIMVVTKKALPGPNLKVLVKGKIDEAFPVGDEKVLMLVEESVETVK